MSQFQRAFDYTFASYWKTLVLIFYKIAKVLQIVKTLVSKQCLGLICKFLFVLWFEASHLTLLGFPSSVKIGDIYLPLQDIWGLMQYLARYSLYLQFWRVLF